MSTDDVPGGRRSQAQRLRPPNERHQVAHVTSRSLHRAVNTVAESWVDMQADVEEINRGRGTRDGADFLVNGRRYRPERSGTVFPVSGPGVHRLDRAAYQALGVYNELGATDEAERELDRRRIPHAARTVARQLWQLERRGS